MGIAMLVTADETQRTPREIRLAGEHFGKLIGALLRSCRTEMHDWQPARGGARCDPGETELVYRVMIPEEVCLPGSDFTGEPKLFGAKTAIEPGPRKPTLGNPSVDFRFAEAHSPHDLFQRPKFVIVGHCD